MTTDTESLRDDLQYAAEHGLTAGHLNGSTAALRRLAAAGFADRQECQRKNSKGWRKVVYYTISDAGAAFLGYDPRDLRYYTPRVSAP